MELHEKLLYLRKANGLTQDEFADAMFVSRQTVYKWETGRALPDVARLRQICDYYSISADELLETRFHSPTSNSKAETESFKPDNLTCIDNTSNKRKAYWLVIISTAAIMLCIALLFFSQPKEIRKAKALGIAESGMTHSLNSVVSERELLTLLANTAKASLGKECTALTKALSNATNEQMTREKAAYWLYCAHIWTAIDPDADMAIEHRSPFDPVTQRSVYEDLNVISKAFVDEITPPWEIELCSELREVAALFSSYDGTMHMDKQINNILYGPYYTSVTFCAAQKSFFSERAILENRGDSFRPKDKITRKEAIIAACRLYESW